MEFDQIYEPVRPVSPAALVPVQRAGGSFSIAKAVGGFFAKAAGPSRIEPRKGATDKGLAPLVRLQQTGVAEKPQARGSSLNYDVLRNLADRDDIIWSIRRTIRMAIGDMEWKIVPDIDRVKQDLKQWETKVLVNLALPGLDLEFVPTAMSVEVYHKAQGVLKDKLRETLQAGSDPSRSPEIRGFFENLVAAHEAIAMSHIGAVERVFKRPNSTQTSLRSLLDLIIDDITLFDSGVIVKNPTLDGKLGELYHIPGEQLRPYRGKDDSTPPTPFVAYDWVKDGKTKAYFNKDELSYLCINPQASGYGKSPLETLVEQMVGSIYGDAYLIDGFANNNMPYAVFDLGPSVNEGERKAAERAWDERVTRGMHRIIFVANKDNVKGFMPIQKTDDKDNTTIETMKYWANRKTAAYNLSLSDIGFTEDIKAKATAENQSGLSQSRGINSFVHSLEHQINEGIIHGRMWVRADPENPNTFAGQSVPVFPFRDVKLTFQEKSTSDKIDQATRLTSLIAAGIMTVNEGRKEEDLPPAPGGDTLTLNGQGLVKVEDLPNIPSPDAQQKQAGGGTAAGNEQPGAPGQEDKPPGSGGTPPGGNAKPGAQPPPGSPKPGAPPIGKGNAMDDIERFALRLAKLVDAG